MKTLVTLDRIRELYCLLLAYQTGVDSREVCAMPWTARRLILANGELKALQAGNTAQAESIRAELVAHESALN